MIVTYAPGGGEPRRWEFAPNQVDVESAELIEVHAGTSFTEWARSTMEGRARALRVLLWYFLRKDLPTLRFEDTPKFNMGAVRVDLGRTELLELQSNLDKVPAAKRDQVRAVVESGLAEFEGEPLPKVD
ncbi:hypothetical protein [Saccharopolyspora shandongensis]|uniref:hypothetical protein n=1 Tax=Saccharopolyspora shandongensis TaxID=418495 RepID=UPI0033EE5F1D